MTNSRFWSFRMFAALWGVLLSPLIATVEAGQAAEGPTPIVHVEWSGLITEEQQTWLQQIPRLIVLIEEDESLEQLCERVDFLCALARAEGQFSLVANGLNSESSEIGLAARLEVDLGSDSAKASAKLRELILGADPDSTFSTIEGNGLAYTRADGDWPLIWGERGGKLLIVNQDGAQSGEKLPEAAAESTARLGRVVGANPKSSWKLRAYCDAQALLQLIRQVAQSQEEWPEKADAVVRELGLDAIRSLYVCVDDQEDGEQSLRAFVETDGQRKGILKLWDQKPLEREDLLLVPRDALWAHVGNWDLAESWRETHRVVEALDPNVALVMDGALGMASAMLGFSITDQVLPAFGDTWAVYDSPKHGGILLTGIVAIADVRDRAAIEGAFARSLELVRPLLMQQNIQLVVRETEYEGHTIRYLLAPGYPVPIAPAAAFVEGRVVCSLTPQAVKLAISQLDPKLRKDSVLDHPDVKRVADQLKGIQRFSYGDTDQVVRSVYPLVNLLKTAVASLGAVDDAACDPALLWTLPEVLNETDSFVIICRADETGILTQTFGNTWLIEPNNTELVTIGLLVSILLPSLSRAREQAKRVASAVNLQGIGQAIHIYANNHNGEFPASLDVLIEESLITPKKLLSPRQDNGEVSYVYIAGQDEDSHPNNVVAYERMLDEEGTNVLFLDGRVEWVRPDLFTKYLADTNARLKQTAEKPAEETP